MGKVKEKIGSLCCHTYLIILSVVALFPLVWVILSSVKGSGELTSNPTSFLPKEFTFINYKNVIDNLGFTVNIGNSLIIALITTVIAITVSSMAAYGIVRFFPRFGNIMSRVLVTTYMFPPILLAIPYSLVMAKLGLTNTRVGLIIVYLSFSVPYAVWMLVGFFKTVPIGIEEAARVDGANAIQTFTKITLPYMLYVTTPYLIVTFTGNINNFNVIYLLSGGDPVTDLSSTAGKTDLLVTWLYKLTIDKQYYNIGAVIGIMTFIILAIGALFTYRNSKSYKEEGGF